MSENQLRNDSDRYADRSGNPIAKRIARSLLHLRGIPRRQEQIGALLGQRPIFDLRDQRSGRIDENGVCTHKFAEHWRDGRIMRTSQQQVGTTFDGFEDAAAFGV